uniref:Protein argonaute MEL1 n=1 Tax=Ananas comosus var. bracteatus TaxID=296719 RepID=A0A6V7NMT0_ANACO|nr:unnamed protein product [Ananas comosus var. bracteatus]
MSQRGEAEAEAEAERRRGRGRGRGRGGGDYNYPREPPPGAEAPAAAACGGGCALVVLLLVGGGGGGARGGGAEAHDQGRGPRSSRVAAAKQEEAAAAVQVARPPASSRAVKYTPRPGFGTVGTRCVVRANHFLVQVADADLCHYDVAISPESKSIAVNRAIISELVRLHRPSLLGGRIPAYDGKKSLYTAGALPFDVKDFAIKLAGEREKEYKVTIRFAGRADLHHLQQFLDGQQRDMPQETIQVLDVVLRETPSTKYVTALRSFFSPTFGQRSDIGEGLECWRGYYQSVRPTQMGLSLNIDICATSFYKAIPIVDFVGENLKLSYNARPLSDRDIKKALRGIRVEATHRRDKCIRYRISGVTSVPMNQLMFPVDEQGTMISVVQYFREQYRYSLKYIHWPCLQAGNDKRPIYLPMEVCKIVEGQRYAKKLNERQVANILRATCQRPQQREQSILEMAAFNDYKNDKYAKEFGMTIADQLVSFNLELACQIFQLKYHESGRERSCNPAVGQWNMINKKMVNGGTIQSWTCLNLSRVPPGDVHRFCGDLVGMCNNIGMQVNPRPSVEIQFANPNRIEAALADVHKKSMGRLQLLIVILPETSGYYGVIKRGNNKQYLENVALKINVKVGGRNTVLEDALRSRLPYITDRPTIIFGADVTHPPPGEDSSASIAAVVASMDWPEVTKYRGLVSAKNIGRRQFKICTRFTKYRQGTQPGGMIRELLIAFHKATNRKPDRIIFYRGYLPPITFVVVQKRHHTRLFPEVHGRREITDRSGNILPGTVVDTQICHPTEFDFYLCSHAGDKQTYSLHVLFDENRFTADGLQMLTNKLCYTYARCTRSVSVVPPAYYAHLAAFRARYYMEGGSSDGGSSSAGGSRSRERPAGVRQLPKIKDNVKDVMFYC